MIKKFLIIFIFLLIIMWLFFLPKVNAETYKEAWPREVSASSKIDTQSLKVTVMQFLGDQRQIFPHNNLDYVTQTKAFVNKNSNSSSTVTTPPELVISGNEHSFLCDGNSKNYIGVFFAIGAGGGWEDKYSSVTITDNGTRISGYGQYTELTFADDDTNRYMAMPLLNLEPGEHTLQFNVKTGDEIEEEKDGLHDVGTIIPEDVNCTFIVKLVVKDESAPETGWSNTPSEDNYYDYAGKEADDAEEALYNNEVRVIVAQQGIRVSKDYESNYSNTFKVIDLTDSCIFKKDKNIDIWIYTEEPGVHGSTHELKLLTTGDNIKEMSTECKDDSDGVESLWGLLKVRLKDPTTYKLQVQLKAEGVNINLELHLKVGDEALTRGDIINIEQEIETSERLCKNDDLRVVIASSEGKPIKTIYNDVGIENSAKKININASSVFNANSYIHVFLYFEHLGADMGKGEHKSDLKFLSNSSNVMIAPITGEFRENPRVWERDDDTNAIGADILLKPTCGESEAKNIKIKLKFTIYEDSSTYYEFDINISASEEDRNREDRSPTVFTDVLTHIGSYIPILSTDGVGKLEEKAGTILKVITNIGTIIAVLMSAVIGVKYMLGSVEEKAEFKKDMLPYLIGSLMLFGICTIVSILQSVGNSINNS